MENNLVAVSKRNLDEILMDFSIDAIIAIDVNCVVIAWNQAATAMYGISKKHGPRKIFI